MIHSTDAGSLPKPEDFNESLFNEGLNLVEDSILYQRKLDQTQPSVAYFTKTIVDGFEIKLDAGIELPCYPQYQPLDIQFIRPFEKLINLPLRDREYRIGSMIIYNPKYTILPEVKVLKEKAPEICKRIGINQIKMKVCISGFTVLERYGIPESYIASLFVGNIVNTENLKTQVIVLDEPGQIQGLEKDTRERCERIYRIAKFKSPDVKTSIHIHTSSQKDFLQYKYLDDIELHSEKISWTGITSRDLENNKKLQVGIAQTAIHDFVEPSDVALKRAETAISEFGLNNIQLFSTDCGMVGWDLLKEAIENYKLVSKTTRKVRERYNLIDKPE